MNSFWQRAITALLFVIVMVLGSSFSSLTFDILFAIIVGGCFWEYYKLIINDDNTTHRIIGSFLSVLSFLTFAWYGSSISIYLILFIVLMELVPLIRILKVDNSLPKHKPIKMLKGIFYSSLAFGVLAILVGHNETFNGWLAIAFLGLIWANDTFAYLTGSMFGKNKILPEVSPKKTWEGFIGGLVFASSLGYLLSIWFPEYGEIQWVIVAIIYATFGTTGDFIESKMKRLAGVKDSGSFMPGHGGFLDRFDAFLFATPFAFLYLKFFA